MPKHCECGRTHQYTTEYGEDLESNGCPGYDDPTTFVPELGMWFCEWCREHCIKESKAEGTRPKPEKCECVDKDGESGF